MVMGMCGRFCCANLLSLGGEFPAPLFAFFVVLP
jgi:hypothetical protein